MGWEILNIIGPLDEVLLIIDDALCHGFEFKVEDGRVLFREME